jgi:hypothetical protein
MRNALIVLLTLACAQASLGQLSGPLSGTLGPGEFHVIDTISVEPGDSLTLMPGTTFNFDGPFPFDIRGTLLAQGTETDSIIFTTDIQDARRHWRGLRFFTDGASTSTLTYCVIQKAIWFGGTGGGVSCYESSPNFANSTIRGNTGRDGGGLYCWSVSSPIFEECAFVANIARQHGGGAYCASASSPRFTGCIFSENEARDYGGGISCQNLSSPAFTNCMVIGNQAGSGSGEGGGGVHCESSLAIFDSCTISLNRAHRDWCSGGGVTCHNSSPTFTNCLIEDNTADAYGGGVYCWEYSAPTFSECTLRSNSVTRSWWHCGGGGVFCNSHSSPKFAHCVFSSNWVHDEGGGVGCRDHSSPTFAHCILNNNSANSNGGGVLCEDYSSPEFTFCTIIGNSAHNGGGAYCGTLCSPVFTRCTLIGNSTVNAGGGICCLWAWAIINSTIIAFSQGSGIHFHNSAGTHVEYCDIFGNTQGTVTFHDNSPSHGPPAIGVLADMNANGDWCDTYSNIFLDPLFIDTLAGDYHLSQGSPCIDAGDPLALPDSDATVADIGVFYFPQESPPFSLSRDSLDFGSLPYREDSTLSFWIHNPTEQTLHAAGIWVTNAAVFHVNPVSARIPPLDSQEVEVSFRPLWNRTYLDSVYITFMGLDEIETVVVQGSGYFDCHVLTGGVIRGSLSATCSPYYVLGDLTIEESDTLAIKPGVVLVFDAPCRLEVHGLLLAEGTPQDSIVFTCDTQFNPDRWRGIRFYNTPDSSRLTHCIIECGRAGGDWPDNAGGGAYCWYSSPVFTQCIFRDNMADLHGGGVYCAYSSPTFTYCTISGNSAGDVGGGVCCFFSDASPIFKYCTFRGNSAWHSGGVFCGDNTPTFTNCTFEGNSASSLAGGLFFSGSSNSLTDCDFVGNRADKNGGAVYCERSPSLVFTNCTFSANSAYRSGSYTGNGGGLYFEDSSPCFSLCTFSDNFAESSGGGGYFHDCSPVFTDCAFDANTAYIDGGGAYYHSSSPTLTNCRLSDNWASGGGGVYCANSSASFTNCILNDNSAGTGGGVYCSSSSDTFINCTFVGNSADLRSGGGVYCLNSSPVLNSTIIAFSQYAGIRFQNGQSSRIEHCNFFGNISGPFSMQNPSHGPPNIGEISTTNANGDPCDQYRNIFLDPMFVDLVAGDYHLLAGSSCIAAADPAGSPPTDIEGNPRPNPPGSFPDIGAYENEDGGHPWVFDLVSPQWGDTCWASDTTLIWHAAFNPELNDTVSYEVWLDTLPDLRTAWEVASDLSDTTFHLSGLSDDHAYYWTVHACDLNSAGTFAESPLMFYTYFPEPLATFVLLEPEDGAQLPRGEVRFCWQAADDPDPNDTILYTLWLTSRDTSFSYLMGVDTCGMLDVGSLLLDDSLVVEWWIEAHSAHPDFTIESASHSHFYPPERLPAQFALHQNWPNPFNLTTVIRYDVKQDGSVRLTIYNLLGRKVTTLADRWHIAGSHTISWNAADSPSGIYFCRMEAPGFMQTRKLVLVK